jgi:hypothetical protein
LFTFEHARAALRDEQEILRTGQLLANMDESRRALTKLDGRGLEMVPYVSYSERFNQRCSGFPGI